MYSDILGKDEDDLELNEDKDAIIEALKYNLDEKEKFINDLLDEITKLERQLEDQEVGIANPGI